MTIRLRHVEIFHTVYIHGSISAASRALGVSQPSVTQTLRHAEAMLGFPLFRREKGRLIPTSDALSLVGEAAAISERAEAFRVLAGNLRRGKEIKLSVSALPVLALGILPSAVAAHRKMRPHISYDLHSSHHEEIARKLAQRDSEVILAFEAPREAPVETIHLGFGRLGIFCCRDDSPVTGEPASLAMLNGRPFVSVANSGPIGALIASALAQAGVAPREAVAARTLHIAAELVRAGIGLAIVDEFTARAAMAPGLCFLPLEPKLQFEIVAIHLKDRAPSAMMLELLDTVRREIAAHKSGL